MPADRLVPYSPSPGKLPAESTRQQGKGRDAGVLLELRALDEPPRSCLAASHFRAFAVACLMAGSIRTVDLRRGSCRPGKSP